LVLATTSAAATEHASKQIAEIGAFKTASTGIEAATAATTAEAHATHWALAANLVVFGTFRFIADNVVGRGDFLELVFC
jgi:hypothetical protein